MNLKRYFLPLAIFALALGACRKKQGVYKIRISVDDANTSRVWLDTVGKTSNGGWIIGNSANNRGFLGGAIENNSPASNLSQDQINNMVSNMVNNGVSIVSYYPSSLTAEQVRATLSSLEEINKNDAIIKSLEIRLIDSKGKEVVLEKRSAGGNNFSKTYEISPGRIFSVSAIAEQTGETISLPKSNWWANGNQVDFKYKEVLDFSNTIDKSDINDAKFKVSAYSGFRIGTIAGVAGSLAVSGASNFANEGTGRRLTDARVTLKIEVIKDGEVVDSKQVTSKKTAELTLQNIVAK